MWAELRRVAAALNGVGEDGAGEDEKKKEGGDLLGRTPPEGERIGRESGGLDAALRRR